MAGCIAQSGERDHDDQDAVDLFGKMQAFTEQKTADHVCHRIDGHEQDSGGKDDGFDFGDAVVEGAEKPGQGGFLWRGSLIVHDCILLQWPV